MLGIRVDSKLDTVIGPETELKGELSVRGSLRLDGRIEGNVSVMDSLFMGKEAHIHGEVHCREGVIAGRIEGNVFAQGAVELQGGAVVIGDITCRNLILDREAFLDGRVKMVQAENESA
jgi:cytoskeletal protein CcmA (bactofilin family)